MSLRATTLGETVAMRTLLQDVSLELHAGSLLAVLGPNGAGKSTLLKLLARERTPQQGHIELEDRPLASWNTAALARVRAVVGQHDSLSFSFTASEVVALGRLPHGAEAPDATQRIVGQALHRVDAFHLADRRYPTLSGGERARIQLARALAQIWQPVEGQGRYLLLDEPTASQDLAHQHHCLSVIRDFARERVGVLVVLHDPNLVLDYADEVLVLKQGRPVALGEPREVLTADLLREVYGVPVRIAQDAESGRRWVQVSMDASATRP